MVLSANNKQQTQPSSKHKTNGYVLLDALLAIAMLAIISSFAIPAYIYGYQSVFWSAKRQRAINLAESSFDALVNARDKMTNELTEGDYGLSADKDGSWMLVPNGDYDLGDFSRVVTIKNHEKNQNLKKFNITINWPQAENFGQFTLSGILESRDSTSLDKIISPITFYYPSDDKPSLGPNIAVEQIDGLEKGDLLLAIVQYNGSSGARVGDSAGQKWREYIQLENGGDHSLAIFFCTYNGEWRDKLVFEAPTEGGMTAVIHSFRSAAPIYVSEPLPEFFVTSNGVSDIQLPPVKTNTDNSLALAVWSINGDNHWKLQSTDWSDIYLPEYYNFPGLGSKGLSLATAKKMIELAGESSPPVNQQQITNGNGGSYTGIGLVLFLESKDN